MNNISTLKSLFPSEKGDFNSEHLKGLIDTTPDFLKWLKVSFASASNLLNTIDFPMSKRLRSTNIHEFVFMKLAENLSNYSELANRVYLNTSTSGNKRNFFTFDNYIFILHKEDATTNNTSVTDLIQNQNASAHIITIEYTLSMMYDSILSLYLQYYEGKTSTFSFRVPLYNSDEDNITDVSQEIVATKPRLSNKVLGKKTVG